MTTPTLTLQCLFDETIRHIAYYLTGYELSCWCAVNRDWRERLNVDLLWRWRCNPTTAEYLRGTQCQVHPHFTSPETETSGLSPVCDSRLAYMREVHLMNNWRNGRYKLASVKNDTRDGQFISFDFPPKDMSYLLIYKNNFVVTRAENRIQVWNVKRSPEKVCEMTLMSRSPIKLFKLSGDNLVVKQNNQVQCFEMLPEKYSFLLFTCRYKFSPKHSFVTSDSSLVALNGSILVELLNDLCLKLQVWNIERQEIIGEHKSSNFGVEFDGDPYLSESYVAVRYKNDLGVNVAGTFCRVYDLSGNLVFTSDEYVKTVDVTVVKDNLFILSGRTVDIFCLNTEQHLEKKKLEGYNITNCVQFDNRVYFVDSAEYLLQLTATSVNKQILCNQEYCKSVISPFTHLDILSNDFALLQTYDHTKGSMSIYLIQLLSGQHPGAWIAKLGSQLHQVSYYHVNSANTKLVIPNKLGLDKMGATSNGSFSVLTLW